MKYQLENMPEALADKVERIIYNALESNPAGLVHAQLDYLTSDALADAGYSRRALDAILESSPRFRRVQNSMAVSHQVYSITFYGMSHPCPEPDAQTIKRLTAKDAGEVGHAASDIRQCLAPYASEAASLASEAAGRLHSLARCGSHTSSERAGEVLADGLNALKASKRRLNKALKEANDLINTLENLTAAEK